MSLEAITWAFKQTLDPGSKITLLALADYADDDGRSFPRVKTLAEKTSLSVRTVRDRLRKLEELGYLVTSSQERLDGSQMSNEYTLVGLYPPADLAGGGGAQLPGGRQTLADHEPPRMTMTSRKSGRHGRARTASSPPRKGGNA